MFLILRNRAAYLFARAVPTPKMAMVILAVLMWVGVILYVARYAWNHASTTFLGG